MRVIAALSEPAVVAKVLAHLDLPTTLPQPAPARAPPSFEEDLDQGAFDLDAEMDQRALKRSTLRGTYPAPGCTRAPTLANAAASSTADVVE